MTDGLFSSWPLADEEPGWRQRGLVIGTFAVGGVLAGALSAALPASTSTSGTCSRQGCWPPSPRSLWRPP